LTLVGFESSAAGVGVVSFDFVGVVVPFDFVGPDEVFVTPFEVFVAVASDFGLLRFGLAVAFALSVFSFGREVKNAPRTSSSSCGASGTPTITTPDIQINAKRIMLNLIKNSP
jgi:hypothetical protein